MMRFAPKMALAGATTLLALLDWTAGTLIAEPEGPNAGPPADEMVPADASLEDTFRATASIDAVAIRIVPASQGYILEATNTSTEIRDVEVEVKVLEVSVNPIARMAPIPQEVASEKVALHCAPGERVRRPLALAGLAPAAPLPAASRVAANSNTGAVLGGPGLRFFRTREFLVARATPERAPQRAQRQASRVTNEAPVFFARPEGQTVLRLALAPTPPATRASSNARR